MNNNIPFPDELEHLDIINSKLNQAVKKAEASVDKLDREYMASKRYMSEYRGELDPHEMFQNELLLTQTDRTGAFAVNVLERLHKLKDSPYFARIDFREQDCRKADKYYIGRFSFNYENELLIFDWRAPISGMFYDYEVGPACFRSPSGQIKGELTRKRQFKIQDGVMEYALESSTGVQDDVLQRELSQTSDEKMKSIISTIQKEQNRIIRNENAETLIIQGVAGSGKTSIALHRIAFLLYRFKNRLNARNITILSPNKVFGDYISNVIPELGEEPVYELSFAEIAEIQLENVIAFEPDRDPLEVQDEKWMKRARFKSSGEFLILLNQYIEALPDLVFVPADYVYGRFTANSSWIKGRFHAYKSFPIKERIRMTADDILDRFKTENIMEEDLPSVGQIRKSLGTMLKFKNTLSLYRVFYTRIGKNSMLAMPSRKTLEWADVYPFLYLHAAFAGLKKSGVTRHLVIDEMQDYSPLQLFVINLLFPCPKTILGDFGQSLNPTLCHSLEDLQKLYPDAELVKLNKSYRSTCEIITFARRIRAVPSLEPVERRGGEPAIISCQSREEELCRLKSAVQDFQNSPGASLGIIVKTDSNAKKLYQKLSQEYDIHLISPESTSFKNGVSVASVRMSKGLEFDHVIIPSADSDTYSTEFDRSLLYIACTRAMHSLTLMYTKDLTRLIN